MKKSRPARTGRWGGGGSATTAVVQEKETNEKLQSAAARDNQGQRGLIEVSPLSAGAPAEGRPDGVWSVGRRL